MTYEIDIDDRALLERFIRYCRENTRSDAQRSERVPSTPEQEDFAKKFELELKRLGYQNVYLNPKDWYVTASIPATAHTLDYPKLGFIAHYDTADFESQHVNPQVIEDYDGQAIALGQSDYVLDPNTFPTLRNYIGDTLVTTDGTTLLGADDKSGMAAIIEAMNYLQQHPEIPHGEIKIAFGPDEEIGMGATRFDIERFDCDFAYTLDFGPLGEYQYETFNASEAIVHFKGKNVHPGTAKGKMINAMQLAIDFHNQLPERDRPEKTAGREGYYHMTNCEGTVEEATVHYIIRDHDREKLTEREALLNQIAKNMNNHYQINTVELEIRQQYANMYEVLKHDMRPVTLLTQAFDHIHIPKFTTAYRGGTDGSILTLRGLPTPNFFCGSEQAHGRYEFVSLQTMVKAAEAIVAIVELANHYGELKI